MFLLLPNNRSSHFSVTSKLVGFSSLPKPKINEELININYIINVLLLRNNFSSHILVTSKLEGFSSLPKSKINVEFINNISIINVLLLFDLYLTISLYIY